MLFSFALVQVFVRWTILSVVCHVSGGTRITDSCCTVTTPGPITVDHCATNYSPMMNRRDHQHDSRNHNKQQDKYRVIEQKQNECMTESNTTTTGTNSETLQLTDEICDYIQNYWKQTREQEDYNDSNKLPWVTLAYAQSLDGIIALSRSCARNESHDVETKSSNLNISCEESWILTHALRSIHDAVLIGGKTLLFDNPRLNNRLFNPYGRHDTTKVNRQLRQNVRRQPVPIVFDTHLHSFRSLLKKLQVQNVNSKENGQCLNNKLPRASNMIICCSYDAACMFRQDCETVGYSYCSSSGGNQYIHDNNPKMNHTYDTYSSCYSNQNDISEGNLRILACNTNPLDGSLDIIHALQLLRSSFGVQSIMVEGGAQILSSFSMIQTHATSSLHSKKNLLTKHLVDLICVTIAPRILGGAHGIGAFSKAASCRSSNCWDHDPQDRITPSVLETDPSRAILRKIGSDWILVAPIAPI